MLAILSIATSISYAQDKNLQLKFSDSISIYSEKAYKRNKGNTFEAIGNVVIISSKDTLYGEKASIDLKSGAVQIEGNVRVISPGLNIYGSSIDFNFNTNKLEIKNARVITEDFNLVANSLKKVGPKKFEANQAQFTTCRDCAESWSLFGQEIFIELDNYVQVHHAIARIKGISVLYFPYIILPIKTERESGLLFPTFSAVLSQGLTFEQPIYWNLDVDKDMTITPRLLGDRGYGLDYEYRQAFDQNSWIEFNDRSIIDSIYLPGKTNWDTSGSQYFRNFTFLESHMQFSKNFNSHFAGGWPRDLDMLSDFDDYMQNYSPDGNSGLYGFLDYRGDNYTMNIEGAYTRNNAISDPLALDEEFVQILPSVNFSTKAYNLIGKDRSILQKALVGIDATMTKFSQVDKNDDFGIRNATRLDARPYMDLHLFDIGAAHFKMNYTFDSQFYRLNNQDDDYFSKYANVFQTSASFTMSKVFGEANVKKIQRQNISSKNIDQELIGNLPELDKNESLDYELVYKNSYKHSQEFKFLHHFTSSSEEIGNGRFKDQITSPSGWFDYEDALKEDIAKLGINDIRTQIPVLNTFEFRWNNTLVKKSVNSTLYQINKRKYDYKKIGYFNVSQGYILSDNSTRRNFKNRLTRLYVDMGYTLQDFNFGLRDYYFHTDSNHKLEFNVEKKFTRLSLLSSYSYNSIDDSKLKTIRVGGQFRPFDAIGFSALQEYDLNAENNIKKIYQVDYMPDNNCWILNLKFRENVVNTRYSFNFVFNFGSDDFANYKENYFSFNRI